MWAGLGWRTDIQAARAIFLRTVSKSSFIPGMASGKVVKGGVFIDRRQSVHMASESELD